MLNIVGYIVWAVKGNPGTICDGAADLADKAGVANMVNCGISWMKYAIYTVRPRLKNASKASSRAHTSHNSYLRPQVCPKSPWPRQGVPERVAEPEDKTRWASPRPPSPQLQRASVGVFVRGEGTNIAGQSSPMQNTTSKVERIIHYGVPRRQLVTPTPI